MRSSVLPMLESAICPRCLIASTMVSPSIAGMESRKLNLKAFSRFNPRSNAVEIVAPLLESPGNMASPCAIPMISAVGMVMVSVFSFPSLLV